RRRWARAIVAGLAIFAVGAASVIVRENVRPDGDSAQAAGETTPARNPTRPRPSPTPAPTQTPEPTPTPEPGVIDQVTRSIGDGFAAAGEQADRALEGAGRSALDGLSRAREGVGDLVDST